jgi:hypothetical protein
MRSRKRDNAGFSDASWKKHRLLLRIARAQAHAYHVTHPLDRCVIIDMHAGTGDGVPLPQMDFFYTTPSSTTAETSVKVAEELRNCDVILCEKRRNRRQRLAARFPTVPIIRDHADVVDLIQPWHRWALVLNDPNGYGDHGITTMEKIAAKLKTDWVIVFNEGALRRILGMDVDPLLPDPPHVARVRRARGQYTWMAEPRIWAQRLGARHMAQSKLIKASGSFRYRILVLSHTLSDAIRAPFWEILL